MLITGYSYSIRAVMKATMYYTDVSAIRLLQEDAFLSDIF